MRHRRRRFARGRRVLRRRAVFVESVRVRVEQAIHDAMRAPRSQWPTSSDLDRVQLAVRRIVDDVVPHRRLRVRVLPFRISAEHVASRELPCIRVRVR